MFLEKVLQEYFSNFKAALGFGLLLVFVALFSFFPNTVLGSGSIFLEYNIDGFFLLLASLFFALVYLVFYSLFISVIILAVRRDLSKVRIHYYVSEMIQKFALKIFTFYTFLFLFLFVAALAFESFGVGVVFASLLSLVVTLATLFVPQSIVIDEVKIREAFRNNIEFILKNFKHFFAVLVVGSILVALVLLVEYAFDFVFLVGRFVSLLLVMVFVLPFMEVMKTYLYMHKFDLIRSSEKKISKKKVLPKPASLVEVKHS